MMGRIGLWVWCCHGLGTLASFGGGGICVVGSVWEHGVQYILCILYDLFIKFKFTN